MTEQLRIMLIDDSEADNYFHKLVIEDSGIDATVESFVYAKDALQELETVALNVLPQIILLDINMPGMNGWEFLEHYATIDVERRRRSKVMAMLSTSLNPDDRKCAELTAGGLQFANKPLTVGMVIEFTQLAND